MSSFYSKFILWLNIQNAKTFIGWGRRTTTKNDQVIVIATLLDGSSHTFHIQPCQKFNSKLFLQRAALPLGGTTKASRHDFEWVVGLVFCIAAWLVTQPTNYVGCSFLLHTTVEAFSQDGCFPLLSLCAMSSSDPAKSELLARQRRMQNGLTTWLYALR